MKQPEYLSTRHSVSLLYAHLVFVTKYRRRIHDNATLTDAEDMLRQVCDGFSVKAVEFNGEPDHVHPLIQYPPQVTLNDLVRRLKGCVRQTAAAGPHRTLQPSPDARPPPDLLLLRHVSRRRTPDRAAAKHREPRPTRLTAGPAIPGLKSGVCTGQKRGSGRGVVHIEAVDDLLGRLRADSTQRHPVHDLVRDAWTYRHDVRLTDALYVALAARLDAPLITTDARLARAGSVRDVRIEVI